MTIQTTRVILDIAWDDQTEDHPAKWDWGTLLDMPQQELPGMPGYILVEHRRRVYPLAAATQGSIVGDLTGLGCLKHELFLVVWHGGYESPQYATFWREEDAWACAERWAQDMEEGVDTIDILRLNQPDPDSTSVEIDVLPPRSEEG